MVDSPGDTKISRVNTADPSGPAIEASTRSPSDLIGQQIDDRFLVLKELGSGGLGTVFLVRDLAAAQQPKPELALKLLRETVTKSKDRDASRSSASPGVLRFIREYRLGTRLRDDRFVRSYDFGTCKHGLYFTMDYLPGGCLPSDGVQLDVPIAVGLGLQILSALDWLHHHRIVHRDIKGNNVLLEFPLEQCPASGSLPRARLSDFGLSKRGELAAESPLSGFLGTPSFLAPEAMELGGSDPRADLYSVGILLYAWLSGVHPYRASQVHLYVVHSGKPFVLKPLHELSPDVPRSVAKVVMGLLERDPTRRTRTAALAFCALWDFWKSNDQGLLLPPLPSLFGSPYLCTAPFVGRRETLLEVRSFVDGLQPQTGEETDWRPWILILEGDPGAGKSRLLCQVRRGLDPKRVRILAGQCLRDSSRPHEGLREVIGKIISAESREGDHDNPGPPGRDPASAPVFDTPPTAEMGSSGQMPPEISGLESLPGLVELSLSLASGSPADSLEAISQQEMRGRMFAEQVTAMLLRQSRVKAMLVILDDVQWLDASGQRLLGFVLRSMALAKRQGHPGRCGFVLCRRSHSTGQDLLSIDSGPSAGDDQADLVSRAEPGHLGWLDELVGELQKLEVQTVQIALPPFSTKDTAELVGALLQHPVDSSLWAFCTTVFGHRTVRPLYVNQVLQLLLQGGKLTTGMLEPRGGGTVIWTGDFRLDPRAAQVSGVPHTIHEAVGEQALGLSAETLEVLSLASAIGKDFDLELVAAALHQNPMVLLDLLDDAVSAGFLTEIEEFDLADAARWTGCRKYAFVHDRIRERFYSALERRKRREIHVALARAIANLRGNDPLGAEELTRHCLVGGLFKQAHEAALIAAASLQQQGFFDRAKGLFEQALMAVARSRIQLKESLSEWVEMDPVVHERYADVCVATGHFDTARVHYEERLSSLPRGPQRLDVQRRLAELNFRQQKYQEAIAPLERLLEEARARVPRSPLWLTLGGLLGMLWVLLRVQLRPRRKLRASSNESRDALLSRTWFALAEACQYLDYRKAMYAASRLGMISLGRGVNTHSSVAFACLSYVFMGVGLKRSARELARLALVLLEDEPSLSPGTKASTQLFLCILSVMEGDLGAARQEQLERSLSEGLHSARLSGDLQHCWVFMVLLISSLRLTGRLASARASVQALLLFSQRYHLDTVAMWARAYMADLRAIESPESSAATAQEPFIREHEATGDQASALCLRALVSFTSALSDRCATLRCEPLLECARQWLERGFLLPGYFPLSSLLAALALIWKAKGEHLTSRDRQEVLRLAKRMRSACSCNGLETPLYLAALGALRWLQGKPQKAVLLFNQGIMKSLGGGLNEHLLDILRLGARIFPAESRQAEHCRSREEAVLEAMRMAPQAQSATLETGHLGPPPALPELSWNLPDV